MAAKKKATEKEETKKVNKTKKSSTETKSSWKLGANLSKLGKDRKLSLEAVKGRRKVLFAATFVLLLVGLYFVKDWFIAATVNGRPITRFALDRELEKMYGSQT